MSELKPGDYFYECSRDLFDKKYLVYRKVILQWNPGEILVGDSKMPRSWTGNYLRGRGNPDPEFARTPEEAVKRRVASDIRNIKARLVELEKERKSLERRAAELEQVDPAVVEVISHPDNFEPCDY